MSHTAVRSDQNQMHSGNDLAEALWMAFLKVIKDRRVSTLSSRCDVDANGKPLVMVAITLGVLMQASSVIN